MVEDCKTIGMSDLKNKIEEARDAEKYCIFWDKNGNAGTYF